jgi:hypothetical protein
MAAHSFCVFCGRPAFGEKRQGTWGLAHSKNLAEQLKPVIANSRRLTVCNKSASWPKGRNPR